MPDRNRFSTPDLQLEEAVISDDTPVDEVTPTSEETTVPDEEGGVSALRQALGDQDLTSDQEAELNIALKEIGDLSEEEAAKWVENHMVMKGTAVDLFAIRSKFGAGGKPIKPEYLEEMLLMIEGYVLSEVEKIYEETGRVSFDTQKPFGLTLSVREAFLVSLTDKNEHPPEWKSGSYFEPGKSIKETVAEAFALLHEWGKKCAAGLDPHRHYAGEVIAKFSWGPSAVMVDRPTTLGSGQVKLIEDNVRALKAGAVTEESVLSGLLAAK